MTEDETVGWHRRLNGNELEQTPGDGVGQGSRAYCCPWGHRVEHRLATEQQYGSSVRLYMDSKSFGILELFEKNGSP